MPTIGALSRARTYTRARPNSMYRMNSDKQVSTTFDGPTDESARRGGTGRRIQVRRSGVHGKGVYAVQKIRKGEIIIEYKGEMITWKQALKRHPHDPKDPDHTFYFHIDDKHVIDAKFGGNAARWINHACKPNCESDIVGDRVFI